MKYLSRAVFLMLCVATSGCTTRDWYEAIRKNERDTCEREIADTERARCLARTADDYDTYTRKRREAEQEQPREDK